MDHLQRDARLRPAGRRLEDGPLPPLPDISPEVLYGAYAARRRPGSGFDDDDEFGPDSRRNWPTRVRSRSAIAFRSCEAAVTSRKLKVCCSTAAETSCVDAATSSAEAHISSAPAAVSSL